MFGAHSKFAQALFVFCGAVLALTGPGLCLAQDATIAPTNTVTADVVVYGATPSGIAAAIEAAHLGKQVFLLEPGQHVGGMTSSGLGTTDMYTQSALGGLVQTFFNKVASIYGPGNTATQK